MDLIYTNDKRIDQGVLSAYAFDLSFGASENDFELTLDASGVRLDYGATVYMGGTEYGGIVDAKKATTTGSTITYKGRTWHGILNSKVIQPDPGADYLVVSGDANTILTMLIDRLGLSALFVAPEDLSGVHISSYKFHRYCNAYDGIRDMLGDNGGKLKIVWRDRAVCLYAEPVVNYAESPVDGDMATLTVEQHAQKVNHLICLGKGNLAEREVIHLYVDQFGQIVKTPYYTGLDDISDVYDNSNTEDLESDGTKRLKELLDVDKADMALTEQDELIYDIGDFVGSTELGSGVSVVATVSQKIVKIKNGTVSINYKTGG